MPDERVCETVKLNLVRFKMAIRVSADKTDSVVTAKDGWDIETGPSGVTAIRGDYAIWVPLPDVSYGTFDPPLSKVAPAGAKK